ncbi:MAG TPA: dephospho-CoA kinase [bacterium]|nr:dephospho-CoA kinase [bacterium]
MIKIGLTGSIGSGKSTVLNLFKNYGFLILDLDLEAKKIIKKNTEEYKKIVDFFGKNILNKEYAIDGKILADIVFSDLLKKKALENIIYPTLRTNIDRILKISKEPAAIIEGAVIIESGYYLKLDKTILVTCDLPGRIKRTHKKFYFDDFIKRDKSQLSQAEKIIKSDFIINNNYGLKFLTPQVELFVSFLKNTLI